MSRVVQGGGDLGREPHRVGDRKLLLAPQPVAERFTLDERHDVEGGAVDLAAVDQAEDVGVMQGGDGLDLAEEPLGADDGGQLGAQDLDGDLAVVLEVGGEEDGRHAALAELAPDPVALLQRGAEATEVAHPGLEGPGTRRCGRRGLRPGIWIGER